MECDGHTCCGCTCYGNTYCGYTCCGNTDCGYTTMAALAVATFTMATLTVAALNGTTLTAAVPARRERWLHLPWLHLLRPCLRVESDRTVLERALVLMQAHARRGTLGVHGGGEGCVLRRLVRGRVRGKG